MPIKATLYGEEKEFRPSPQQADFLDDLEHGESHILLEARAGSGKSTTCRQGAHRLGRRKSIYLCFNKHIADEFQSDLPPTCRASTFHSLGFRLLRDALGEVSVNPDKVLHIAERYFERWEERPERTAISRLVSMCKNLGIDGGDPEELIGLAVDFDIEIPGDSRGDVIAAVPEVLRTCREELATVDYDDMIWLPLILDIRPPASPDVLFVDEAQDLNPIQHALIPLICPSGRIVIVGDRYQSIYAFRGADSESIPRLEAILRDSRRGLSSFPLTVTRRCPSSHVALARNIVRDIEPMPDAPAGSIASMMPEDIDYWIDHASPGDMVLSRVNAPLVGACYRLLKSGIPATVRGRDIGKGLLTLIARLRARDVPGLIRAIEDHRIAETAKLSHLRNPAPKIRILDDKCQCLESLCEDADSIEEVKHRTVEYFSDINESNSVTLSSVHRAKGLERGHVIILRPDLLPGPWAETPEDIQQEKNLAYVAATRSKSRLTFAGATPPVLLGRHQWRLD